MDNVLRHNFNVYLTQQIEKQKKILEDLVKDLESAVNNKYTSTSLITDLHVSATKHMAILDCYIDLKKVLNIEKGK